MDEEASVVVALGPTGTGKSTLLNLILGQENLFPVDHSAEVNYFHFHRNNPLSLGLKALLVSLDLGGIIRNQDVFLPSILQD
mgnify:CR=1 FL=1